MQGALVFKSKILKPNFNNKITICFSPENPGDVSSSKTGTDSNDWSPSMRLVTTDAPRDDFEYKGIIYPLSEFKDERRSGAEFDPDVVPGRVILHEFGHALGAEHEHQNPNGNPLIINKEKVYDRYCCPNNLLIDDCGIRNKECIQEAHSNVIDRYNCDDNYCTKFDPDSIMLYPLEDEQLGNIENITKKKL
jgi:hypothetical protein